jgi:FkbM family methyltransferase
LLAASVVGSQGRVDAFEPIPRTADAMRRNIALNSLAGFVRVHEFAVSASERTARFSAHMDVSNAERADGELEARCVALDVYPPDLPKWAAAKLDLEGNEVAALRGMSARLERADPPVLVIEALSSQLRKLGYSKAELLAILDAYDYMPCAYANSTGLTVLESWPSGQNLIAVHRDHLEDAVERTGRGHRQPRCATPRSGV